MDRILRRSLGVSETAPTDTTVKPAPPIDASIPTDEELFDDSHLKIDPELLGLKIGAPQLKDPEEWEPPQEIDDLDSQHPLGHDEL